MDICTLGVCHKILAKYEQRHKVRRSGARILEFHNSAASMQWWEGLCQRVNIEKWAALAILGWVKLAPSPSAVCFSSDLQLLEVSDTARVYDNNKLKQQTTMTTNNN